MPTFRTYLHGRDDATSDSNSAGPGQRISVDGGMESKRGVIAMILAIVLFIVVIVIYQHLTTEMARREEVSSSGSRHRHRRSKPDDSGFIADKISALFDRCFSLVKRALSSMRRQQSPSPTTSHSSLEALLKFRPRRAPARQQFFSIPCLKRRKESKEKAAARLVPRPLLLNIDAGYTTYTPRSPIDEKTYDVLRSPDAFVEFSDPVRNMNFARRRDEFQRRRERDEVWYEEPVSSPDRPSDACVAPLALRRKTREEKLLREGDDANGNWIPPSPERIIYPSRQSGAVMSATPPPSPPTFGRESWDESSISYVPYSPRSLSTINEVTEPLTPRSFFEHDDDDDGSSRKRRRTFSLRIPFSSHKKTAPSKDPDVFSIGSYSSSEE